MIKRGSNVIYHRPAFDKLIEDKKHGMIQRDDQGNVKMKFKHHTAKDYEAHCFSVFTRPKLGKATALIRYGGKQKLVEVPLDQLEEVVKDKDHGSNDSQ